MVRNGTSSFPQRTFFGEQASNETLVLTMNNGEFATSKKRSTKNALCMASSARPDLVEKVASRPRRRGKTRRAAEPKRSAITGTPTGKKPNPTQPKKVMTVNQNRYDPTVADPVLKIKKVSEYPWMIPLWEFLFLSYSLEIPETVP